jgi:hypothetical protein
MPLPFRVRPSWLAAALSVVACLGVSRPARAEPQLEIELRLADFFVGTNPQTTDDGYLLGGHVGEAYWVGRAGIHAMGGAELGFLALGGQSGSGAHFDGTASFSAEIGMLMLLGGSHEPMSGTVLSVSWAPRVLVNFVGGEVASPAAGEVALRFDVFKVPVWFMKSLDGTIFLGGGLGFQI